MFFKNVLVQQFMGTPEDPLGTKQVDYKKFLCY